MFENLLNWIINANGKNVKIEYLFVDILLFLKFFGVYGVSLNGYSKFIQSFNIIITIKIITHQKLFASKIYIYRFHLKFI